MNPDPNIPNTSAPEPTATPTSLAGRLLNVFAAPGEVFDEIKNAPPQAINWLAPVLIYAVVGVISVCILFAQPAIQQTIHDQQVKAMDKMVQQGKMTQPQEDQALQVMDKFMGPGMLAVFGSFGAVLNSFILLFGWALVLWLLAKWFFKARLNYMKMAEMVGLSSIIVVLGIVISTLLCVILGRLTAGPSLGLLVNNFDVTNRLHLLLAAVNVVNIWHVAVLGVGMAKLCGGRMPKAFVVVFGFWVAIILLLIGIGAGNWAL